MYVYTARYITTYIYIHIWYTYINDMISVCIIYIYDMYIIYVYTSIYHYNISRLAESPFFQGPARIFWRLYLMLDWISECCQHRIKKELLRLSSYTIANFHCHMPPSFPTSMESFVTQLDWLQHNLDSGLNFIIPINFASQVTHRKAPFLTRICCKMLLQTFNMLHWWYSEIENDESDANANGYQTYDRSRALYLF